jgi:hypothetical protein
MYWADKVVGDIRRANLDGTDQITLLKGLPGPTIVALDIAGGKMYWADEVAGEILRANLDARAKKSSFGTKIVLMASLSTYLTTRSIGPSFLSGTFGVRT